MPQACSVECSDDLASTDEIKVYKDEGDDEKRSSEILSEEKFGLVTETEDVCAPSSSFIIVVYKAPLNETQWRRKYVYNRRNTVPG